MCIKTGSINEHLIVTSGGGGFKNANAETCDVLWAEKDELIGRPFKIIFSKNEPLINISGFCSIREKDSYKEGHKVCLEASRTSLFDCLGVFEGYLGVGKDTTERNNLG